MPTKLSCHKICSFFIEGFPKSKLLRIKTGDLDFGLTIVFYYVNPNLM